MSLLREWHQEKKRVGWPDYPEYACPVWAPSPYGFWIGLWAEDAELDFHHPPSHYLKCISQGMKRDPWARVLLADLVRILKTLPDGTGREDIVAALKGNEAVEIHHSLNGATRIVERAGAPTELVELVRRQSLWLKGRSMDNVELRGRGALRYGQEYMKAKVLHSEGAKEEPPAEDEVLDTGELKITFKPKGAEPWELLIPANEWRTTPESP